MGSGDALLHSKRRVAIIKEFPEVLKLAGCDSSTQYFAYALFLIQVIFAYVVRDSLGGAIVLGMIVSPYVDMTILSLIHEVSHALVFTYLPYNKLLGIFCNTVFLAPCSEVFRQHHTMHHLHLGDVQKDVDVPGKREMAAVGNSIILKTGWLALSMFILPIRSLKKLPVKWDEMMVLNWAACLGFALVVFILSKPAFVYLFLGMVLSQSAHPANARQVQRHINTTKGEKDDGKRIIDDESIPLHERKLNTFSYYGILNLWTLNVGYHVEHHDFGNIPWSRLPELKRIAGEKWYPSGAAYSSRGVGDILAFIFNKRVTLADYAGR